MATHPKINPYEVNLVYYRFVNFKEKPPNFLGILNINSKYYNPMRNYDILGN